MFDVNSKPEVLSFSVQVGHTTVNVKGGSREEALQEARRQLCQDMPRMFDVIQLLDDSRFQVVPLR
jgi:hypothetical protein